jgi:drug/metabolite transporter (DMT)-like permease
MVGMPSAEALNTTGVILALGTALLYAVYLPALHNAQEGIPPLTASFFLVTGVLTAFFSATALSGRLQAPSTADMWGLVILLAVLSTVIAFVTLVAGLRVLGPIRTSIVSTIEPFFTTLLGVTFLRESFTIATITGGILIAAAVILLQLTGRERMTVEAAG